MKNKIILLLLIITMFVSLNVMFPRAPLSERTESTVDESISNELKDYPGKGIFDFYEQHLSSRNKKFLSTSEFLFLINSQQEVLLDKDVFLNLGIFIEKSVKITGGESRKKIYINNVSVALTVFEDNVVFENIDFYLTNNQFFLQGREEKKNRLPENISFKNCKFFVNGKTNLTFKINGLNIQDSMIVNERKTFLSESSFLWFTGRGLTVESSVFVDLFGGVQYPVYINKSKNIKIKNNVLISNQPDVKGMITVSESDNILIENNLFKDLNKTPKLMALNNIEDEEESGEELVFLDSGIAVWIFKVSNLELKNNLFAVKNEYFDQERNQNKINEEILNFDIDKKYFINCYENKKIISLLSLNSHLNCRN